MIVKATRPRSHSSPTRESTSVAVSAAAGVARRADTGRESSRTFDEDPRERPKRTDRSVPGVPWTVIGTPNAFRVASTTGPGPVSVPMIVTGALPWSPKRVFHLPGAAEPLRLNVFPLASYCDAIDPPTLTIAPLTTHCPVPTVGGAEGDGDAADAGDVGAVPDGVVLVEADGVGMGDGDAMDSVAVAGVAMPRLATNPAAVAASPSETIARRVADSSALRLAFIGRLHRIAVRGASLLGLRRQLDKC